MVEFYEAYRESPISLLATQFPLLVSFQSSSTQSTIIIAGQCLCLATNGTAAARTRHRWTNLVVICVECRRYAARWLCDDCEEVYCVGCYAFVHRHGTKVIGPGTGEMHPCDLLICYVSHVCLIKLGPGFRPALALPVTIRTVPVKRMYFSHRSTQSMEKTATPNDFHHTRFVWFGWFVWSGGYCAESNIVAKRF